MMHALKWWKLHTRMHFDGGPDGAGGGEAPAPSGGGGGGESGVTSPSPSGGGSGPAPSPAATPAPSATPAPTAAPATPTAPDWSNLGSVDDLDYLAEIPTEPQVPPVVAPPVVPPTAPPQAAPPAATAPPAAAPPQPPPSGAAERPITAAEPWRIAEGLEANRDAIIAHLAQAKFALTEADIKDLDTDVTVAVPKLLARVFLESQVSMQKFLAQAVPGMLKQYNTVSSANTAAEKQFFTAHPALDINNPQHRAAAVRIATVYRQANPNIPLNQLIAEVGPMVMTALQLAPTAAQPTGHPAAPPRGGVPFRPAVNGGGGVSPAAEPANEWAGLGRDYD
jgi:hypothetical protein